MKQLDDAEKIIGILQLRVSGVKVGALEAFDRYSSVDLVKHAIHKLAPLLDEEAWK